MILFMAVGAFKIPAEYHFDPHCFDDNVQARDFISVTDDAVSFSYGEKDALYNDEGKIIGDDLLTGKFSMASGAYDVTVRYSAENSDAYVELYSDSWVAEPISEMIDVGSGQGEAGARIYVPFGRSLHGVQINIHYSGPGKLSIYGIDLKEDVSYRWVPIAGYLLLFILIDLILFIIFAHSGAGLRTFIRDQWQIPALLSVAFIASLPAFSDCIYFGHDIRFHLARIVAISHEISYGQFPVRMLTDMLKGYSYPTSTFYCDLFIYPFALLYKLGLPIHMVWQSNIIILNLATTFISYFAFKRISEKRDIGVIGAAVYTLSAYRIVDIYLRTALGEFTALTFIPLVILGIWIIYYGEDEDRTGWLCLGAGMSAIAMCHLLSLEMISLFLVVFCLLEYRKTFSSYRLVSIGKAALMTVLLSCWFIMPMLQYMSQVSLSMNDHMKYIQMSGAYPSQVFNIFLQGQGFSGTGTYNEMPLSIGGGIIGALALLLYRILKRDSGDRGKQRVALTITIISLLISMYFFPWDSIASITEGRINVLSNLVRLVQFPWRYLEITTAILSVSAVFGLKEISDRADQDSKISLHLWIGILLLGTVISTGSFYMHFVDEDKPLKIYGEQYIDNEIAFEEYLPSDSGRLADLPLEAEVAKGHPQISSYTAEHGERKLEIINPGESSTVLIPVFAYPGYRAEDLVSHEAMSYEHGDRARIALKIPENYTGTIRVYYREPMLWRVFEIISCVSLIGYGIIIASSIKSNPLNDKQ